MSVAPAGWYADPENPTAQRYWSGTAWAAPVPAKKKARASKVLASFAIGVGALGPGSIIGAVAWALVLLLVALAFGMPGGNLSGLGVVLLGWAASGAQFGIPFVVIGLVLATIATLVKPRAGTGLIAAAWVIVGLGVAAAALALVVARPLEF